MKDVTKDLRVQILIRPQGINRHVGKEVFTEEYEHLNEMLLEINKLIEETVDFIEERYQDEDYAGKKS